MPTASFAMLGPRRAAGVLCLVVQCFVVMGLVVLCLVLLATSACGGGQTRGHPLERSWSDEDGGELAAFVKRWKPPNAPQVPDVVVGVVNDHELVGEAIAQGKRWRFRHPLDSRPQIAGSVVVAMGDSHLFALDVVSGEEIWSRKALGRLRGVADDGSTTVVSIESMSGKRTTVLAIARDGSVTRQLYEEGRLGVPAVFDEFVFLPRGDETVSIFDLIAGTEVARVVADGPVDRAVLVGSDLYLGGGRERNTAFRFDDDVVDVRHGGGTRIRAPRRDIPGSPWWFGPGHTPRLMSGSTERVRYLGRPTTGAKGVHVDGWALMYHRITVGLGPKGTTRWVDTHAHTLLDGTAAQGSFMLCDAAGRVRWLDHESGRELHTASLEVRLIACAVQSKRAPNVQGSGAAPSLEAELYAALSAGDARLLPLQLELLEDLAGIEGNAASARLIDVATDSVASERRSPLAERARELLAARRSGADAMLSALQAARTAPRFPLRWGSWHPRFEPPALPLVPLASALSAMRERRAAPLLASYLGHLALSDPERGRLAEALASLAGREQQRDLAVFLALYGCSRASPASARAAIRVAEALVRLGHAALVERAGSSEACDDATMRKRLRSTIAGPPG